MNANTNFMDTMVTEVSAKINEERVRDLFLAAVANSCTEKIQDAAASSTGKYHPAFAHGKGGLLRHIRAAVHFVEKYSVSFGLNPLEKDIAVAAAALHDLCKSGINWDSKYTVFEHPILVRALIDSCSLLGDDAILWGQICDAIDSHMGCWNKPTQRDVENRLDEIIDSFKLVGRYVPNNIRDMSLQEIQDALALPTPKTPVQIVVATADYTSSDSALHLKGIFDDEAEYWEEAMSSYEKEEPASEKQKNYVSVLYTQYKEKNPDSTKWDWIQNAVSGFGKKKAGSVIWQLKKELENV